MSNNINDQLYIAALSGEADQVRDLLAQGADPNQANAQGNTPLHGACCRHAADVIPLLLEAGADPNAMNGSGLSPLGRLLGRSDDLDEQGVSTRAIPALRALMAAPKLVAERGLWDLEHLSKPSQRGLLEPLAEVLPAGWAGRAGITLGHLACAQLAHCEDEDTWSLLRRLAKAGARLDAADYAGRTPAHWLLDQVRDNLCLDSPPPGMITNISRGLTRLQHLGADLTARDKAGRTLLRCLARAVWDPTLKYLTGKRLEQAKAQRGVHPSRAGWPGQACAAARTLINRGVDPLAQDTGGKMALDGLLNHLPIEETKAYLPLIETCAKGLGPIKTPPRHHRKWREEVATVAEARPRNNRWDALYKAVYETTDTPNLDDYIDLYFCNDGGELKSALLLAMDDDQQAKSKWKQALRLAGARQQNKGLDAQAEREPPPPAPVSLAAALLNAGARAGGRQGPHAATPLTYAICEGYLAPIDPLLTAGAPVDELGRVGMTPLSCHREYMGHRRHYYYGIHRIPKNHDFRPLIRKLIKAGADVNQPDRHDETLAMNVDNTHVMNELLAAGADMNARNDEGATVFHRSAALGYLEDATLGRMWVQAHGPNMRDIHGNTPLHRLSMEHARRYSSYREDRERTWPKRLLATDGLDPNALNKAGHSPLMCVVEGNLEPLPHEDDLLTHLLALGADPNAGENVLPDKMATIQQNHMRALRVRLSLLLANGLDPNLPDKEGATLLHGACKNYRTPASTFSLILNGGGNPDLTDSHGQLPLTYMLSHNGLSKARVELLLAHMDNPAAAGPALVRSLFSERRKDRYYDKRKLELERATVQGLLVDYGVEEGLNPDHPPRAAAAPGLRA